MKFSNIVKAFVLSFVLAAWTNAHAIDATVTFTDNAANEAGFSLQRNLNGGAWVYLTPLAASPGSGATVQVTDTTLVQSTTVANKYCYRAASYSSSGATSSWTNTPTPGVTDCKVIPVPVVDIPVGPTGMLVK